MLRQRSQPYRDRKWLAAVHQIENCVLCGAYGVQAAHRNMGKGMGMKVSDALTAALCPECHVRIDSGRDLTRDERRAMLDDAIIRTIEQLVDRGLVCVRSA